MIRFRSNRILMLLPFCRLLTTVMLLAIAGSASAQQATISVRSGIVQLIERTELASEDNGLLAELNVKLGDEVQAGDVLAIVNDGEAKLVMEQAALELKHAKIEAESGAEILRAERVMQYYLTDWERALEVAKRNPGAFSLSELDKKKLDYETAKLDIELAREQQQLKAAMADIKQKMFEQAQHLWERRRIRSPIDGVIERLDGRPGEWVREGDRLLLVVNAKRLRVQGLIPKKDFHPRLAGAKASVQIDAPGLDNQKLMGTVSFVSTENDPRTGDIRVDIDFDNPKNLVRPGMPAVVQINTGNLRDP